MRLVLMGEGGAKAGLAHIRENAEPSRRKRLVLRPHGTSDEARALMREADLGLVSLVPGVIAYAYPSKTATYLSEGLPVLAAVEADSSLARDVEAWGVGVHLPLETPQAAAEVLAGLLERADAAERGERAREVWSREFAVEGRLERWDELMGRVGLPLSTSGSVVAR